MREIKFRVWDKRTSHMSLVANMSFGDDGSARTIIAEPAPKGHYYNAIVHGESGMLMQFTGLKDAKGKEIFESDIVKIEDGMMYSASAKTMVEGRYRVVWSYDKWALIDNNNNDYDNGAYYQDEYVNWDKSEIIGNIYENPELIEVH